jgi:hypothetical protein
LKKMLVCGLLALATAAFTFGCNDDDDDFSHHPPPGKGCIIVNNTTFHDIRVYINGSSTNLTYEDDWEYYDLNPGVYRVVLEERHGDRSYRDDIDVIEGRRTILDVTDGVRWDEYDVYLYFD